MQCDYCSKKLLEDDTLERILCTSCYNKSDPSPPKIHCAKCACLVGASKAAKMYKKAHKAAKEFFKQETNSITRRVWFVVMVLTIIIVGIFPFNHMLSAKLAAGMFMIPAAIALLVLLVFIFVIIFIFGIAHIGLGVSKWFKWNLNLTNDEVGLWFVGLLTLALPVGFYFVGHLILGLIARFV